MLFRSELPTTCFAEDEGSLTNSSRWLQWHWAGQDAPFEAKSDVWIMANIFNRLKALYAKDGGAFAEPMTKLTWNYKNANDPQPAELAREFNGYVVADVPDPNDPTKKLLEKGKQMAAFGLLRDDGTTACGNWIYCGSWTEPDATSADGNKMARRDNRDPSGLGVYQNWSFSWPANRRILYNRASADMAGKPWDEKRAPIAWNGAAWAGDRKSTR